MKAERTEVENGWLIFIPDYLQDEKATYLFGFFQDELKWEQNEITLFGKTHPTPRLEAWYAMPNLSYTYSGKKLKINPFNPGLKELKKQLNDDFGADFNSVLANLYRNGNDSNGWHSDDERELGKNPLIASLSLGAPRRFDLKHKITGEKRSIVLGHGSLLIMGGELQHFWKHQVAKSKAIPESRINLTFRKICV